jgi:phage shock protein C
MTLAQDLENLEKMRDRGSLNETEFAQAKARLLQSHAQLDGTRALALNGLRRSSTDKWLGGVCAGLAQFTGLDAWLWRLAFTLMLIVGGTGFLVYLLLWILVPPDTAR